MVASKWRCKPLKSLNPRPEMVWLPRTNRPRPLVERQQKARRRAKRR